MGDCGADMAVELEAGLIADRDPTSQFVIQGEEKGRCPVMRGLGMNGRASVVVDISLGTNTSSQCTLLAT